MRAIICESYGAPDVLRLKEVEKPTPAENQVLVKVYAAAANPLDWHQMRGAPFLVRLSDGLTKPKTTRIGADFAGRVEAVGSAVTQFRPGDEVFGAANGAFAEYMVVREGRLALKPANLSYEEAAAVPIAAITALQGLRDTGHIQSGQNVLVNGAAGGVGTFAVQIAKSYGTHVTGVCSTRNVEMVRSIGADQVIDYTRDDFTRHGECYDLIYDAVGNRSVADYKRALKPGGICVVAGFTGLPRLFEHMVIGPLTSRNGGKKVGLMPIAAIKPDDLGVLKDLLETGKIHPVIDRRYALDQAAEAIRYLETGHARGKVIIPIAQPG